MSKILWLNQYQNVFVLFDICFIYCCLQPGNGFEVVPGSQFTVSRTARKDNTSDYYLDGKKQTFKEIGIVLRGCGIDLDHNRFLILQVIKINNTR